MVDGGVEIGMLYDIAPLSHWEAPEQNGAALLAMPNIPKPLHGQAPRVIVGEAKWQIMRTKCYMGAHYTCEICGKYLGKGKTDAHEVYDVDYANRKSTFVRAVCVCKTCHSSIHCGRAITSYKKGKKGFTRDILLKQAKHTFQLVADYNYSHPAAPIRLHGSWVEWLKCPELAKWMVPMIEQYSIGFYSPTPDDGAPEYWGDWRLVFKGKEYQPKYPTLEAWDEAFGHEPHN